MLRLVWWPLAIILFLVLRPYNMYISLESDFSELVTPKYPKQNDYPFIAFIHRSHFLEVLDNPEGKQKLATQLAMALPGDVEIRAEDIRLSEVRDSAFPAVRVAFEDAPGTVRLEVELILRLVTVDERELQAYIVARNLVADFSLAGSRLPLPGPVLDGVLFYLNQSILEGSQLRLSLREWIKNPVVQDFTMPTDGGSVDIRVTIPGQTLQLDDLTLYAARDGLVLAGRLGL